ncbi:o-succinylbenzoate synthase [Rubrivirga marina]|uniref:o-succinylbenzoate synthase n=1 Tax=Rubrivirga marina TaxID=1196024 RepID=A0A271J3P5_9BACT|nr:o-succinylbenzoate synthase [Rubrivirga marina]PAP77898.1 o-succinylbenzoate synthase [Rubrivirga marina]
MTIADVRVLPYRLPLAEPVMWNSERREARDGLLFRVESIGGHVGWGDAAPLPGFSRESLAEAESTLRDLGAALVGREIDVGAGLPGGALAAALDAAGLPASVRFAVDLALLDLAALEVGRTPPQVLHPDPAVVLPLNGLVMGTGDAAVESALWLAKAGYVAVKLKVGRQRVAEDVALVRAVDEALPAAVALRLDANRAWSWDEAVAFAEGVDGVVLDYVEEPLAEPERMPELWHDTGLPLALDETLQEPGGGTAIRGWAEAAVLKPTLLGGVARTLALAAAARAAGVRPVLSAAFESGVGLRGIAALAAATGAEPAGLDTYRWLAADVLSPLPFDRARVDMPGLFASPPAVSIP